MDLLLNFTFVVYKHDGGEVFGLNADSELDLFFLDLLFRDYTVQL